mgnify:CR=1 FL=1
MNPVTREQRDEAIAHFKYEGTLVKDCPYGSGHINDTFLLIFEIAEMGRIKVILQRMNSAAFPKPIEVMENITGVTSFLKKKIIENGGDPERETLNVIPAVDGKPYYIDSTGDYWRSYKFITDASTYDLVEKPEQFYESAVAFGNFQSLLSDYPAETLHETIEKFHDTRNRFALFKKAVEEDVMGRAASVEKEIRFVLEREEIANCFAEMLDRHELPLRVTHNDTKLNNIMFSKNGKHAMCLIDLDTVMKGSLVYDYGDALRLGASTAAEDEVDLSKVSINLDLVGAFTKGFLEETKDIITKEEIALLFYGYYIITLELGMRFLTDYLDGDKYFALSEEQKKKRPKINLERARNQLKLVLEIEKNQIKLENIIDQTLIQLGYERNKDE